MPSPLVQTQIAGHSIPELAAQYSTPLYVYDAQTIVQRIAELKRFDVIRFAQKACSNIAVLDLMRRHGVLVDAVSSGEVARAVAAGFKLGPGEPAQVVYTADIFDRESLDLVINQGVPVNCGSPDMLDQYGARSAELGKAPLGVTLRVNPGFGHGHSQKTNTGGEQSKHGIWHTDIADCKQRAGRHGLSITGLHMHIGSGTDLEHLGQVCGALEKTALEIGPSIHSISAGGGISTPYREGDVRADLSGYFELWDAARRRLAEAFGHAVSLEIEPGRYLAAESGWLISEVRAVKQQGNNLFYLVDAGFNNLARPILYGAYHPMTICPGEGGEASGEGRASTGEPSAPRLSNHTDGATHGHPTQKVVVGGPLCESGDIFTQDEGGFVNQRELPEARVGDFLVIGCAGAYGAVMGSNYNSKPLAAEVLIEEGKAHLVRERQTSDDLLRGEKLVSY
ncbi:Diaminopimelate decarboxylase [Pirellulimonas nuda]|uniref:Diaminopimelate decarboxylase n=1 Tax=Pirellulimonas nuda TaxID=2528009 RepID=A0A518D6Q9_9BACT|nr:diaminopimelate decarboxylase [Pirellulimonas nuda]QDU87167.1 Diaminopimelate decarboxylase [Pirellulimonas nuda]